MGSVYIFILLTTLGLIGMLLLKLFSAKLSWAGKPYDKLKEIFLWNYIIRLVFEACIELTFVMILNTSPQARIFESSNFLEFMDYMYTILFNILICIGPIFIVVFYNMNYAKWETDEFTGKYGTILEGLQMSRSALFYPFFFMIRRAILAVVARFCFNNVWL